MIQQIIDFINIHPTGALLGAIAIVISLYCLTGRSFKSKLVIVLGGICIMGVIFLNYLRTM